MLEILCQVLPNRVFAPVGEEAEENCQRFKAGSHVWLSIRQAVNIRFRRKMHALFRLAYNHFCEHCPTTVVHNGRPVRPSYDVFRHDLMVLAGHYDAVFDINGNMKLVAKSIAYDKCSDVEAEQIFSDCIDVCLRMVYSNTAMEEVTLRELVEQFTRFGS